MPSALALGTAADEEERKCISDKGWSPIGNETAIGVTKGETKF